MATKNTTMYESILEGREAFVATLGDKNTHIYMSYCSFFIMDELFAIILCPSVVEN